MKLVIEDDEGNRQEIPVDGLDEVTLGRAPGNTVQLTERNVSRKHARFFPQAGTLVVEDLHSANGILVNGHKVTEPRALQDGDLLRIGDYGVVLQHDTDIHRIQVVEAEPIEAPPPDLGTHDTAPHAVAVLVTEARPRLLALNGRLQGTLWTLGRSEVRVGKDPQAELSIPHRSLADFHAKLLQTPGNDWRVQELEGLGVRVNGVEYADSPLHDGDVLEFGSLRLRFVGPGAPAPQLRRRARSRFPLVLGVLVVLGLLGFLGVREFRPGLFASATPPLPPRPEEPVLEVSPSTVTPVPPPTSTPAPPVGDALSQARAAMQARDYPHALQLLATVRDPHRASEVASLRKTARGEAAAGRAVAAAQHELDAGRPGAALRQLKGAKGTHAWALEAEVIRSRATEAMKPKSSSKSSLKGATAGGEVVALYQEGRHFYDTGQLTEAVASFNRCLEKDEEFARCHLMLAASYDKLGQMDDAERHYRRFLALAPAGDPEVARVKKVLEDSDNQKKATGQAPPR
jgi:ABC transport system ATP-binding/permease protein